MIIRIPFNFLYYSSCEPLSPTVTFTFRTITVTKRIIRAATTFYYHLLVFLPAAHFSVPIKDDTLDAEVVFTGTFATNDYVVPMPSVVMMKLMMSMVVMMTIM